MVLRVREEEEEGEEERGEERRKGNSKPTG